MPSPYTPKRPAIRPIGPSISYVVLSQGMYALIDSCDAEWIEQYNWQALKQNGVDKGFYAGHRPKMPKVNKWKGIRMHQAIMLPDRGLDVDHINRNKLDNRRCNLRAVTRQINIWNSVRSEKPKSGYCGVSRGNKVWVAVINHCGKRIRIGQFEDLIEAAIAYDKKATELRGEFAVLNFPKGAIYDPS